jgi:hypothetical protein
LLISLSDVITVSLLLSSLREPRRAGSAGGLARLALGVSSLLLSLPSSLL